MIWHGYLIPCKSSSLRCKSHAVAYHAMKYFAGNKMGFFLTSQLLPSKQYEEWYFYYSDNVGNYL